MMNRYLTLVAAAAASFAMVDAAHARMRVIDAGPVTYLVSGHGWIYNHINLTSNASCDRTSGQCGVPIGFPIRIGSRTYDRLHISENGLITFDSPLSEGDTASRPLSSITQPYIAPFFADLSSIDESSDGLGEITWGPGRIDYAEDPDICDDTSPLTYFQGEKAFRVDWTGVNRLYNSSNQPIFVQIIIYDRGAGNFDLELNYGMVERTEYELRGAQIGFRLGASFFQHSESEIDNRDPSLFRFRNGVWIGE